MAQARQPWSTISASNRSTSGASGVVCAASRSSDGSGPVRTVTVPTRPHGIPAASKTEASRIGRRRLAVRARDAREDQFLARMRVEERRKFGQGEAGVRRAQPESAHARRRRRLGYDGDGAPAERLSRKGGAGSGALTANGDKHRPRERPRASHARQFTETGTAALPAASTTARASGPSVRDALTSAPRVIAGRLPPRDDSARRAADRIRASRACPPPPAPLGLRRLARQDAGAGQAQAQAAPGRRARGRPLAR